MKPYSQAYNRDVSRRKALRKKRITEFYSWAKEHPYYDNLHQFSKNKIHCSCSMCSTKTRNKGRRRYHKGNYSKALNYSAKDMRRLLAMEDSEREYFGYSKTNYRNTSW